VNDTLINLKMTRWMINFKIKININIMEDKNRSAMSDQDSHDRKFPTNNEGQAEGRDAIAPSGDDLISKGLEEKHHQQHGNRKYQAFKNHSSARDQPGTITGTTPNP